MRLVTGERREERFWVHSTAALLRGPLSPEMAPRVWQRAGMASSRE